jgi:type II secretory pathway pseudopilin PulG
MATRTRIAAAGFTLLELLIAAVLLTVMSLAVATLSLSGTEAQSFASRLNRVTELNQELIDDMRLDIVTNVRLFGDDAEGNDNLAALDLAGAPAPLPGLRLPTLSTASQLRPDSAGSEITGNSLFFAKLAWKDRFSCSSGNEYLVDVYRWVYYYLAPRDGGPTPGSPVGLDLVRVVSEPLADASSIDRITDPADQAELLQHLQAATADAAGVVHAPLDVVWRRGSHPGAAGTFRQIDQTTGSLSDTPLAGRPDPWRVLRSDSDVQGLLSYRRHSVATNFADPAWGVGRFGLTTTTGSGFPHGFEVQTVGPSSARQILLRLVIAGTDRHGRRAWSSAQIVADCRDL